MLNWLRNELGWFGFGLGWVGFGFGLGWVGLVVLNECFRTTLAQHILSKLYSLSQHTLMRVLHGCLV